MDALREQRFRTLTAGDLAGIPDFRLGEATVSPSRRILKGPGGTADLQPRVMQVLVVLAQSAGQVVSRETLFDRCWGGVYVGDDSLNRVVAALRRLGAEIGGGSFEIETIPRTGYRLTGATAEAVQQDGHPMSERLTRRQLAGGAVGLIALGGLGAWSALKSREERRFDRLLKDGDDALAGEDDMFRPDIALRSFEAAVRIHPDSARAVGRLALAQSYFAQVATANDSAAAAALAAQTIQKALAIDPKEPNALMATFELQGSALDWLSRDRLLRQVVAIDPRNCLALGELAGVLMAAGLCRESWDWNERLLVLTPLSEICLVSRAFKLWVFGHLPDADNILNQLRAQYPNGGWLRSSRFLLYALTDRPKAAQAMLDSAPNMLRPGPENVMWRSCLDALARRTPDAIAGARDACISAARISGDLAGQGVMVLCELGEVDSAFEIANGYLLSRGPLVQQGKRPYGREPPDATHRINTKWLFMPPCKNMRADGRFLPLCEGVGLVEYWRRRGVQPDYVRLDR